MKLMICLFVDSFLIYLCIKGRYNQKNEKGNITENSYRLIFSIYHSLCDHENNLAWKISMLIYSIVIYIWAFISFAEIYFKDWNAVYIMLNESMVKFFFVMLAILFMIWISDICLGLIVYLAKYISIIAGERYGVSNKKKRFYYVIFIITVFNAIWLDISFQLLSKNDLHIIVSLIILILLGINISDYIVELLRRIIAGNEFNSKNAAIQECLLIYVVLILLLTELLFFSTKIWSGLYLGVSEISMFQCFRTCAMTFLGLSSELTPNNELAHTIIFVIHMVGFVATGFIAVEIFSSVVANDRSSQEEYWKTRYELEHIICSINKTKVILNKKTSIKEIEKDALSEIINDVPSQIDSMYYYSGYRNRMNNYLEGYSRLLNELGNVKSNISGRKITDIREQINNYLDKFLLIENDLQKKWNEKII